MTKIVLVGAGGYGAVYLRMLTQYVDPARFTLCGIVDPYVKSSSFYPWILEQKIPLYNTLEEFYQADFAPLCIISTPIPCHRPQIITAFSHGSHVLCEKPLAATQEDILHIGAAAAKYGRKLGVGFQWSFCDPILNLKADIAKGIYGKPVCFKTKISWPRQKSYYQDSPWKGRICNAAGEPVYDSILTNATAHYMHNMLFVNGCGMKDYRVLTARANPIQTFDTCLLTGTAENGCKIFYGVTHAGEPQVNPTFVYEFENGKVVYDQNRADDLIGMPNGKEPIFYGEILTDAAGSQKITKMLDSIENDTPVVCSVEEILPHAKLAADIFAHLDAVQFAPDRVTDTGDRFYVPGLWEEIAAAYDACSLPDSL